VSHLILAIDTTHETGSLALVRAGQTAIDTTREAGSLAPVRAGETAIHTTREAGSLAPVRAGETAIHTTHETGSLAPVRAGETAAEMETIDEMVLRAPTGFAHVIYGHIAGMLRRNGLDLAAVDCFAAASGPGSFTGVRVGLACVKGLAEALGRPAAAVSNLRAMAAFGTAPLRAAVLDARRGEVYGAVYGADGKLVAPETVAPFPVWLESLPAGEIEFVCGGGYAPQLAGTRFANARVVAAPEALAAAVGRLAGEAGDPAALDANYVRRPDAELLWKDTV
jgi:tRNA threonylcarbamoyladenosine biosynthesis protein TsaB